MVERGVSIDHSTIHRWVVRYTPQLLDAFNARKRPVTGKWHVVETYIKVRGEWTYLYQAIDKGGATVDFLFSPTRNIKDPKRFFRRAYARHGLPAQVKSTVARPTGRQRGDATPRCGCAPDRTPNRSRSGTAST